MTNIIKEAWLGTPTSDCLDHLASRLHLLRQIETRWGRWVATNTNLETGVMNPVRWHFAGFKIKPGEKSLHGVRLVPPKRLGSATTIHKPVPVIVYHWRQIEPRY